MQTKVVKLRIELASHLFSVLNMKPETALHNTNRKDSFLNTSIYIVNNRQMTVISSNVECTLVYSTSDNNDHVIKMMEEAEAKQAKWLDYELEIPWPADNLEIITKGTPAEQITVDQPLQLVHIEEVSVEVAQMRRGTDGQLWLYLRGRQDHVEFTLKYYQDKH